jgi:tRNA threonylcarbamoyladenosine biosynthesis protein TsaB
MIIALHTATPTCTLYVHTQSIWHEHQWEAGRGLAKGLVAYIEEVVTEFGAFPDGIDGIIAFKGPGSFTGLRIGLTVLNTIANAQQIPIVGASGDSWLTDGLERLQQGENDQLVMPEYGSEPHITVARK